MNIEMKDVLAILGELEVLRRHQEQQLAALQAEKDAEKADNTE